MFDGVHIAQRKAELDHKKMDRFKCRRIELKVERTLTLQCQTQWSKKHGHDVYGDSGDSNEEGVELKPKRSKVSRQQPEGSARHAGPPLICNPTTEIALTRG